MEKQISILFLFLLSINFISMSTEGYTSHEQVQEKADHQGSLKLFVFGDSYADTGNQKKSMNSWNKPYGMTFPGRPAGRFSKGCVLTDYIESPVPHALRKYARISELECGMNFAYGGSGVFNTVFQAPNMTSQIDLCQKLVENKIYNESELRSSVALVSLAGNNYTTFKAGNGNNHTIDGTKAFSESMIEQLTKNLERFGGLGLRKIMVTGIEPLGCLPTSIAVSGFKSCDATDNEYAKFHNKLLRKAVHRMNSERGRFVFGILDLYTAFMSAFKREINSGELENPLKPCCVGVNSNYTCGDVDEKGEKMYVVCNVLGYGTPYSERLAFSLYGSTTRSTQAPTIKTASFSLYKSWFKFSFS